MDKGQWTSQIYLLAPPMVLLMMAWTTLDIKKQAKARESRLLYGMYISMIAAMAVIFIVSLYIYAKGFDLI